jgi:hypothetical protein
MSMNRIQYLFAITKRGYSFAALFAMILALAGFANADAMSSAHPHKAKKGSFTITAPTEVGGTLLQPGDYEVKEVKSPSGPVLEFIHQFDNFYAPEGESVHEEEVVAHVAFTEQAVNAPPKRTQLLLASDSTEAIGLQIRGSGVEYVLAPQTLSATSDAKVDCANTGHE